MKIKKGDTVKILIGKDKDKTGKVERVYPGTGKVLVADVNQYKRHIKSKSRDQKSEIVTITKPLPASNVGLICPKCKKTTRIGFKIEKDKKFRICRKCKALI
ncbi:MAG: 50S ribosomal protein L24 [Candidatus Levybacteria bacterium RIFCSPHIGHO2_01_FULL_40_10]|nr:MAG: 50S ribosomal protein L24 [Candidatus Levybacteria bacterium RIFCSPHIGHO2_01_FULL_40_10]